MSCITVYWLKIFEGVFHIKKIKNLNGRLLYHLATNIPYAFNKTYFLKIEMILMLAKYNHKYSEESNLLTCRRFSIRFINDLSIFFYLKKKKKKSGVSPLNFPNI